MGRPVVVDEWSVVVSQLGNVLMVCLESVDDREGVRGASGHICRRVQPKSRRLEVLHKSILRGNVLCIGESGMEHKPWRGGVVGIEIYLRSRGRVPPGLGRLAVDAVSRIVLVRLLGNVIPREGSGTDRCCDRS